MMMRRLERTLVVKALMLALLSASVPWAHGQTVTAVPKLDLPAFTGTWYEIARYPNKWEKRCAGNAVILVALGDKTNHIQFVQACKTKAGYMDSLNIDGKAQDKCGDGKLKLGSLPLFHKKLWVLAVGPDHAWSLLGSPNHKDVWIYSKTKEMNPELFAQVQAQAFAQGFSVSKLTMTPQNLP